MSKLKSHEIDRILENYLNEQVEPDQEFKLDAEHFEKIAVGSAYLRPPAG